MNNTFARTIGVTFALYIFGSAFLLVPRYLIVSYLEARDCRVAHDVEVCMYVMQPVENSHD